MTSAGDIVPVNNVYTDGGPVSQQVSQISGFIQSNEPSFELKLDMPWWVIILIGGLGLMGWIIVFISMVSGVMRASAGRY